ncbi:MAG TPA: EAL domain-containing protein, partial [Candidatus Anaerobutyricum stercoris]|nr:EAL domain-containing protein [Candidatus Anaerobutyricum stercoris]
ISMDDFGSGYSSLNILGNLHIDELKLDRGFLLEVSDGKNARSRVIMEQIVQLTRRLKISTVVEGVETVENEKLCLDMGCDLGQGYYYSRPIPREEFNRKYMKLTQK